MRDVAKRTALPLRSARTFREVWEAFAPTGESRLLFADDSEGETQAVLLLVRCGTRVVEPYGGMTDSAAPQIVKLFGRETPKLGVLTFSNMHDYEHYGNMVTYMRLKKIVPPSSEPKK